MREVSDYVREALFLVEEALPNGSDDIQKVLKEFAPKFQLLIDNQTSETILKDRYNSSDDSMLYLSSNWSVGGYSEGGINITKSNNIPPLLVERAIEQGSDSEFEIQIRRDQVNFEAGQRH